MRTVMLATGTMLALLLGGCGDQPAEQTNAAPTAETEDAANRLAALPDGQRNAVFIRAIRDAGQDCQQVESSVRAGDYQGNPVWSAQCAGGDSWTIVVTPDGTAQLVNESEARLVGVNEAAPRNGQAE